MDQSQILTTRRSVQWIQQGKQQLNPAAAPFQPSNTAIINTPDGVMVPSNIPEETNVGQPVLTRTLNHVQAKFGRAIEWKWKEPELDIRPAVFGQCSFEDVMTGELCKIDDIEDYVEACEKYRDGVQKGWTKEQLLDMIGKIRSRAGNVEGDHELREK